MPYTYLIDYLNDFISCLLLFYRCGLAVQVTDTEFLFIGKHAEHQSINREENDVYCQVQPGLARSSKPLPVPDFCLFIGSKP